MKIELESPYDKAYKAGYLAVNKEPRRVLSLIRFDGTRTSTSYSRYLLSCHLNQFLEQDEHVDHKDDNQMNDVVDNLQILSQRDNNLKKIKSLNKCCKKDITLTCPVCKSLFSRPARNVEFKIKSGKYPCCSRRCGGINSHISKFNQ